MDGALGRLTSPVTGRWMWRQWAHLIMGGALAMPYVLLGTLATGWAFPDPGGTSSLLVWGISLVLGLPLIAATALLIPAVRVIEVTAARELLGPRAATLSIGSARSWSRRWRSALWFAVHLLLGAVVSGLTLSMPPLGAVLIAEPFADFRLGTWASPFAPAAGVAVLVGTVYVAAGAGTALARLAPVLLGPSPSERVAELEEQANRLAERNRLARELHDSVGHALTSTTLQASAAGRVLDSDPDFARRALAAIEDAGRAALEDLDHVLGLLRDEASGTNPPRTLADLDHLLARTRATGVPVEAEFTGDVAKVPPAVSREAYRIVQEGLTNALRHAGKVPVTLRLLVRDEDLALDITNPIAQRIRHDHKGGRGLSGMRERVTILRGEMTATEERHQWHVAVRLPLRSRS